MEELFYLIIRVKKNGNLLIKTKMENIGLISWSRIIEDELFIEKFKSLVENKKCTN